MATKAPQSQSDFKPTPQGTHVARCFQFIHIGTVKETIKGVEQEMNKIRLVFELPQELRDDGKPFTIGADYTLSMSPKANLKKFVDGMLGKSLDKQESGDFDVESLVGKACLLNVIHKQSQSTGNTYAQIAGSTPLVKGMECPDQVNPSLVFNYSDNYNAETLESLPDFIKDKIKSSAEFNSLDMI
jgi:hypothetical protein